MSDVINAFPGYEFKYVDGDTKKHNIYMDTDIGFGGYIRSWAGMYWNAVVLDCISLHPHSIINMNYFGKYTQRYKNILDARVLIKHGDLDGAKELLGEKAARYLDDPSTAKDLAQALKISLNSCYGLTSAKFQNPMRHPMNNNNIVALRGALFMRTLQDEVEKRGYQIIAIKTDSIKIPNATKEIVDFCMEFAKPYGYTFEFESCYDRICQVNDADYIAKYKDLEWCEKTFGMIPSNNKKHAGEWTVTGAKFATPYIFKSLFTKEPITFDDFCETKEVKSAIYLDMNESLPEGEHEYTFVGRVGQFCPIKPGCGGGELVRTNKDKDGNIKYDSVSGTKGYRWLESEVVKELGKEDDIDKSYYRKLVDDAVEAISQYGDFEQFVSDDPVKPVEPKLEEPPWLMPCGKESCEGCKHFYNDQFHMDCDLGYDISDLQAMNAMTNDEYPF